MQAGYASRPCCVTFCRRNGMKMNTRCGFYGALLMAAAYLSVTTAAQVTPQPASPEDTAQILEQIRGKYNLPGLAVSVVKDGKVCDRLP